jgi:DNA-binding IclR family transcriptional regulator
MLAVLDPVTVDHSEWMAEDLSEALHDTNSSTNRTIRELCRTGLLARLPGGSYIVGAQVIHLETVIRRVDLIAKAVPPVLHDQSVQTGCASLLSSVYWMRGAPGKAVLAILPPRAQALRQFAPWHRPARTPADPAVPAQAHPPCRLLHQWRRAGRARRRLWRARHS